MRLTFRLELSLQQGDSAYPLEVDEKLVLGAWTGEKMWHVVLKLFGYLLFYEQRPRIEEGIGWHFKPDLVRLDDRGRVALWVDCGNIAPRKIGRVANKVGESGRFFILKRQRRTGEHLLRTLESKIKHPDRVHVIAFDDRLVDDMAGSLDGTNRLVASRTQHRLDMQLSNRRGDMDFATAVHRLS